MTALPRKFAGTAALYQASSAEASLDIFRIDFNACAGGIPRRAQLRQCLVPAECPDCIEELINSESPHAASVLYSHLAASASQHLTFVVSAGCIQLPARQRPTAQQALDIIVESMSVKEPEL